MKLRFTPRAAENLAAVADYLRARNPEAAQHVRNAIYESLQNLILFPQLGRQQKPEEVRKLVTRKYAYCVYYTVNTDGDEIVILNVKHPAQQREFPDA